jgi:hypothetical protein
VQREHEHLPGTPAPATGHYEELNVFGARTGKVAHVEEGEEMPSAPRGFTWRRITSRTAVNGP